MQTAINHHTAAIFYLARAMDQPASIPLNQVVATGHDADLTVIVDAASECPPLSILTRFPQEGADLTILSGGKSIMGPQSTGLIIGDQDLLAACAANGVPFSAIRRPMKVSREEVIAFAKALDLYLRRDHQTDQTRWENQLSIIEELLADVSNITLERLDNGQTYVVPLLSIHFEPRRGISRNEFISALALSWRTGYCN